MSRSHGKKSAWATVITVIVLLISAIVWLYDNGYIELGSGNSGVNTRFDGEYAFTDGYGMGIVREANSVLGDLPVMRGQKSLSGYDRDADFGGFDYDMDNSGCNTREDIRMVSLVDVRNDGCKVKSGILSYDPYTGERDVKWDRSSAASLQVDHIVALGDAYSSGAMRWGSDPELDKFAKSSGASLDPEQRRREIANDPLNLVLADGSENQSKGAKSADLWMVPSNPAYSCEYAARQVLVKNRYGLAVSEPEKAALSNTFRACLANK